MSSIRLFVLGSLAERGPMHGHALRLLAEEEHIDEWADVAASAIYAVIKRLAHESLVYTVRTEREGNYPQRQVFDLTDNGRRALQRIRREALEQLVMRPDPVDLALARLDESSLESLEATIASRISHLEANLEHELNQAGSIAHFLSPMERHIMRHDYHRIRGELAWHHELLEALPELIADERSRKALSK